MNNAGVPFLRAEKVSKNFKKGKEQIPVLRGIDLTLFQGEAVAVTGQSGAGKSTLLHVLGTLEAPSQGRILFGKENRDLAKFSEKELSIFRNRTLGFVFQFHYLLSEFTALENVMMPALIAGFAESSAKQQALTLLDFVGLKHRLNHRPSELSGGEQQRVAIARAVILRPKLLLADELTGNLDTANSQMVLDLLVRLNRETGISVLLVTHDLKLAKKMHRVLMMSDGRLIQSS